MRWLKYPLIAVASVAVVLLVMSLLVLAAAVVPAGCEHVVVGICGGGAS